MKIPGAERPLSVYIAGNPGTGKTSLIQRMALQDIERGHGVCVIDATGDVASRLVHWVPRERAKQTIYFDADDPIPIDFFSYRNPSERQVLTDQLIALIDIETAKRSRPHLMGILGTLFDANDEIDRRTLTGDLSGEPHRCTFLDIKNFIEDKERRDQIIVYCPHRFKEWNPFPKFEHETITSRIKPFAEAPVLRAMFACKRPLLNIREVMHVVAPFVWTGFSVFKRKNCSASRRRGGGNVKIGFIDFQGLVGRSENSSIVFRAFHKTGISTACFVSH